MGKKTKVGKARKDKFYFLAKQSGYRSRAAFKLLQLNRQFGFLNSAKVLIDLCAAPGGWLQVAQQAMPVPSLIIGVDLVRIDPIPNVKTMQADITTDKCRQLLKKELNTWKADVIIHDGAPNVGANWALDEFQQAQLCLQAFALATEMLRSNGWFITKVFRSKDYEPLKWVLDQFFQVVKSIKPEASRLESAEIYLVCQRYKAPDRIDPKFLDFRHVFKDLDEGRTVSQGSLINLHKPEKRKKKAEGYGDGDSLFYKLPVSEFFASEEFLQRLARANMIVFDMPEVENHPLTTVALKECLKDIKVLGKPELRAVLKWRQKMMKILQEKNKPKEDEETTEKVPEKNEEELVDEEINRLLTEEEKEKKRKQKKVRKSKSKLTERLQLKMVHPDDQIEEVDDLDMFSLATVHKARGSVARENEVPLTEMDAEMAAEEEEMAKDKVKRTTHGFTEKGTNADNEWDQSDAESDHDSDPLSSDGEMDVDEDDMEEEDDDAISDSDEGHHPLLVDLNPAGSKKDSWYERDAFKDLQPDSDLSEGEDDVSDEEGDVSEEEDQEEKGAEKKKKQMEEDDEKKSRKRKKNVTFNVEEEAENDDDDSDSDSDSGSKRPRLQGSLTPEELAIGAKLVRSAKSRRDLVESTYHRYRFPQENVPAWFADDERRHMRKLPPVTKEEVEAQKLRMREVNTRTPKKIAEAQARKKMKQARKLKRVRSRAEAISDDIPEKEKWGQIKQMYKKAGLLGKKKRPISYIVNNKSGARQGTAMKKGAKTKVVDRRLKKDTRAAKRVDKKAGGKGKGRGKKGRR